MTSTADRLEPFPTPFTTIIPATGFAVLNFANTSRWCLKLSVAGISLMSSTRRSFHVYTTRSMSIRTPTVVASPAIPVPFQHQPRFPGSTLLRSTDGTPGAVDPQGRKLSDTSLLLLLRNWVDLSLRPTVSSGKPVVQRSWIRLCVNVMERSAL